MTQNQRKIASKFSLSQRAVPDNSSFLIKYIVLSQANLSINMIKTLFTSNVALIALLSIGIIFLLIGFTAKKSNDLLEKSLTSPLKEARKYFEKEYLTNQLKKNHGNISKTADFIGMERSALHRKLKELGIKGIN